MNYLKPSLSRPLPHRVLGNSLKLSIMGNEKAVSGNTIVPLHGRPFTRAFASKLITSSEEKKANAPKKRAVLKDITNVTCESSYASCFNAAKAQVFLLNYIHNALLLKFI